MFQLAGLRIVNDSVGLQAEHTVGNAFLKEAIDDQDLDIGRRQAGDMQAAEALARHDHAVFVNDELAAQSAGNLALNRDLDRAPRIGERFGRINDRRVVRFGEGRSRGGFGGFVERSLGR